MQFCAQELRVHQEQAVFELYLSRVRSGTGGSPRELSKEWKYGL